MSLVELTVVLSPLPRALPVVLITSAPDGKLKAEFCLFCQGLLIKQASLLCPVEWVCVYFSYCLGVKVGTRSRHPFTSVVCSSVLLCGGFVFAFFPALDSGAFAVSYPCSTPQSTSSAPVTSVKGMNELMILCFQEFGLIVGLTRTLLFRLILF